MKYLIIFLCIICSTHTSAQLNNKTTESNINNILSAIKKDDVNAYISVFPRPDTLFAYKSKQDINYKNAYEYIKNNPAKINKLRRNNRRFIYARYINHRYNRVLINEWDRLILKSIDNIDSRVLNGKRIERKYLVLEESITKSIFILSVELKYLIYRDLFVDFRIDEIFTGFKTIDEIEYYFKHNNELVIDVEDTSKNENPLQNDKERLENTIYCSKLKKDSICFNFNERIIWKTRYFNNLSINLNNQILFFKQKERLFIPNILIYDNQKEMELSADLDMVYNKSYSILYLRNNNEINGYIFNKEYNKIISKLDLVKLLPTQYNRQ